jgi:cell division protein FtsL
MTFYALLDVFRHNTSALVMIIAVVISAMSVVYLKHLGRAEFVTLHKLEQQRDHLNEEWGRLLLEQSTWATPSRIEQQAKRRLKMLVPASESVVVIQQ